MLTRATPRRSAYSPEFNVPNLCAGSRSTSQGDAVVGVAGENKQSDKKERNKDNQNIDEKGKAESK